MSLPFTPSHLLLPLFIVLFHFTDLPIAAINDSYLKLQLFHINPINTPSDTLLHDKHRISALHHHHHRHSHRHRHCHRNHNSLKSPLISGASTGSGQYFAGISIGTPPQNLLLVADTGSDLTWVRCSACRDCSAHPPGSIFLARHSASFSPSHCFDPVCRLVPHSPTLSHHCNHTTRVHNSCWYEYKYGDGSTTSGIFSHETASFNGSSGNSVKINGFSLGCGFEVSGPSLSGPAFNGASGVMGLGRGPISLSAQLGRKFSNKFSYCLMDYTLSPPPTSYLIIGDGHDVVLGNAKLLSTPLITNSLAPTFYYIGIKSVIIDGLKLPISPSVWALDDLGNGGTVIDSGTTLSFLPEPAYRQILTVMRQRVRVPRIDESTKGFDLCVNVSGVDRLSLPRMSFVLAGDSVFDLPPRNYFINTGEDAVCLALQAVNSPSGFSVIGNLMQQGFLFEFDNDRSRLLFSRNGCGNPSR